MYKLNDIEQEILDDLLNRRPELMMSIGALLEFHEILIKTYDLGGKLLICGNGGSHADAIHIAGELAKSFERKRTLPARFAKSLLKLPFGEELKQHLEVGLPAIPLGVSGSLKTAVENDSALRDIAYAQEAFALLKPEDTLLGISTSGNAKNVRMALSVAHAVGASTVSLTGPNGGAMAEFAQIAIKAPGNSVKVIQESHLSLYHTTCALIEAHYFPEMRT